MNEAIAKFLSDDNWRREYRKKSIRAALKAAEVPDEELEPMVARLMEDRP